MSSAEKKLSLLQESDSDSSSDSDGESALESKKNPEGDLTINKEYATRYENWRKKEEYQRLKDKYGDQVLSEGSELSGDDDYDDDSSSDSDQEELNKKLSEEIFDEDFLKVYGALKRKDPKLLDPTFKYVNNDSLFSGPSTSGDEPKPKKEKESKMTLLDYHQKLIKQKKGITEEDEDQGPSSSIDQSSYHQELEDIKKSLKEAAASDSDSDSGSDSDELIKGMKTSSSSSTPSRGNALAIETSDQNIQFLKEMWTSDQVDEQEKFLRDFIVNKKYLDQPKKNLDPDSFFGNFHKNDSFHQPGDEGVKKQLMSASQIKHRHEEEGGDEIRRFPRDIMSARDLDSKDVAKEKRKEKKDRKKKEKEDDLKRFTQLRKEQQTKRITELKSISLNHKMSQEDADLFNFVDDTDFDPEKYDKLMGTMFDKSYYDQGGSGGGADMDDNEEDGEKPVFSFVPGIDDDIEKDMETVKGIDEAMESDGEDEDMEEDKVDTKKMSRRKKDRIKKLEEKRKKKRINIDKLPDYDDIIGGDLPIRFKYRPVKANDFGLDLEEIMLADDKDLNKWASLKRAVGYRDEADEERDHSLFLSRKNDINYKQKILKSLFTDEKGQDDVANDVEGDIEGGNDGEVKGKKKRKRKKNPLKSTPVQDERNEDEVKKGDDTLTEKSSEKAVEEDDPQPQKGAGDDEKVEPGNKKKRKRKRGKKESAPDAPDETSSVNDSQKVKEPPGSVSTVDRKTKRRNRNPNNRHMKMSDSRLAAYGITVNQAKRRRIF